MYMVIRAGNLEPSKIAGTHRRKKIVSVILNSSVYITGEKTDMGKPLFKASDGG
jgi:hypothetical protein